MNLIDVCIPVNAFFLPPRTGNPGFKPVIDVHLPLDIGCLPKERFRTNDAHPVTLKATASEINGFWNRIPGTLPAP